MFHRDDDRAGQAPAEPVEPSSVVSGADGTSAETASSGDASSEPSTRVEPPTGTEPAATEQPVASEPPTWVEPLPWAAAQAPYRPVTEAYRPIVPVEPTATTGSERVPTSTDPVSRGSGRRTGSIVGAAVLSAVLAVAGTAALVAGPLSPYHEASATASPPVAAAAAAASTPTAAPEADLSAVVAKVRDSVVTITSEGFSSRLVQIPSSGVGSGVVLTAKATS